MDKQVINSEQAAVDDDQRVDQEAKAHFRLDRLEIREVRGDEDQVVRKKPQKLSTCVSPFGDSECVPEISIHQSVPFVLLSSNIRLRPRPRLVCQISFLDMATGFLDRLLIEMKTAQSSDKLIRTLFLIGNASKN